MGQFGLGGQQRVLRRAAVGQVDDEDEDPGIALAIHREVDAEHHRQPRPVGAGDLGIALERPRAADEGGKDADEAGVVVAEHVVDRQRAGVGHPQHRPERRVHPDDARRPPGPGDQCRIRRDGCRQAGGVPHIAQHGADRRPVFLDHADAAALEHPAIAAFAPHKGGMGGLAGGDVGVGLEHAKRLAEAVGMQRPAAFHDDLGAGAGAVDQPPFPPARSRQRGIDRGAGLRIAGGEQAVGRLPHRLGRGPAIDLFGRTVPEGDGAGAVPHEDHVVRDVDQTGHRRQPFGCRAVCQRQRRGDRDGGQADQRPQAGRADRRGAVRGEIGRDGEAQADPGRDQDVGPPPGPGRDQHDDDIQHGDCPLERGQHVDQQDGDRQQRGDGAQGAAAQARGPVGRGTQVGRHAAGPCSGSLCLAGRRRPVAPIAAAPPQTSV